MEAPAIGKRVFADGMSGLQHKQSLLSQVVAISTLFLYVGWLTILLGLLIAAFFYRWAVYALIAIFSTLLLPAKPVLWWVQAAWGVCTPPFLVAPATPLL